VRCVAVAAHCPAKGGHLQRSRFLTFLTVAPGKAVAIRGKRTCDPHPDPTSRLALWLPFHRLQETGGGPLHHPSPLPSPPRFPSSLVVILPSRLIPCTMCHVVSGPFELALSVPSHPYKLANLAAMNPVLSSNPTADHLQGLDRRNPPRI